MEGSRTTCRREVYSVSQPFGDALVNFNQQLKKKIPKLISGMQNGPAAKNLPALVEEAEPAAGEANWTPA